MTKKNPRSTSHIDIKKLHEDNKTLGRGWTAKSKHSNATLFSEGKGKKKEITRDELDLKIKEFLDRGGKIDRMQNELRPSEFDTDEELREKSKIEQEQFLLDNVKHTHRIVGVDDFF